MHIGQDFSLLTHKYLRMLNGISNKLTHLKKFLHSNHSEMKRLLDFAMALTASLVLLLPIFLVSILVRLTSPGPILYWSDRVGGHGVLFRMPKFRTMHIDTPAVATHLFENPGKYLTPIGGFLRKTSLDELPQLWSILKGDMSFVGPRPALFNQTDLIALRARSGVSRLRPGLTGWAQINGRDELPIPEKARLDEEYLQKAGIAFDLRILFLTIGKVLKRDGIRH
jgi:O-antigen biosynthesis protein WbqP